MKEAEDRETDAAIDDSEVLEDRIRDMKRHFRLLQPRLRISCEPPLSTSNFPADPQSRNILRSDSYPLPEVEYGDS